MLTFDSLWCPAPTSLTLSSDEVHIWRASLGLTSSQVQKLEQTLTIDEIGRAARYYFPNDRRRFIISRGLLRSILSFYLNTEPDQLRFRYGTNGKPLLAAATGRDILSFNLSHSGELVLYAVTRRRRVGIDLERVRPDIRRLIPSKPLRMSQVSCRQRGLSNPVIHGGFQLVKPVLEQAISGQSVRNNLCQTGTDHTGIRAGEEQGHPPAELGHLVSMCVR